MRFRNLSNAFPVVFESMLCQHIMNACHSIGFLIYFISPQAQGCFLNINLLKW